MSLRIIDKDFDIYINEESIQKKVKEIGAEINEEYKGQTPLFVAILNGSFMFAGDLMKSIEIPCEISFVKVSSYQNTESTGQINELVGMKESTSGRHIVILEDIIDSGYTMEWIMEFFKNSDAKSIEIATLLHKPEAAKKEFHIKFKGFEIPNKFVVGYGLDYNGRGRNLRDIYQLKS